MIEQERIQSTFCDIVALDATSRNEQAVGTFVTDRLQRLGLQVKRDSIGNVIGFFSGHGETILLNAHMDRVPPGKGHTPIIHNGIASTDGTTNLGADDAAGITILLEAMRTIIEKELPHPPIVLAFTVQEEIGLFGAKALDVSEYNVIKGLVYDNAFEAGVVVSRGAAYVAFGVDVQGKGGHPGKNLAGTANAIEVFVKADAHVPIGASDEGQTRTTIGTISGGSARNAIPNHVELQGEVRSFLDDVSLQQRVTTIANAFSEAAQEVGATAKFTSNQLAVSYTVDLDEPLVKQYKEVVEKRGGIFQVKETFVASDANALRGESGLKVFTISTGVSNEHSVEETVDLTEVKQLTEDLVSLLTVLGA